MSYTGRKCAAFILYTLRNNFGVPPGYAVFSFGLGLRGITKTGRTHELKTWPAEFTAIVESKKTFDFRLDDRGFAPGDQVVFSEWTPTAEEAAAQRAAPLTVPLEDALGYERAAGEQGAALQLAEAITRWVVRHAERESLFMSPAPATTIDPTALLEFVQVETGIPHERFGAWCDDENEKRTTPPTGADL